MALVTKSTTGHIDTVSAQYAPQISDGLVAGEALDVMAPCYVKASDGKVYMSNGTAANEAAGFDGFTPRQVPVGQPVTLIGIGLKMEYAEGLTVGQLLYIGTTAGRLDTAATTGGTTPVAKAFTSKHIRVIRNG